MKIQDATTLIAFLWGSHPNAPKQSPDERENTIAAYFYVLCDFSLQDAINGAHLACMDKPGFVPTAYEIRAKCTKTYSVPGAEAIKAEMAASLDKMALIIMQKNPFVSQMIAESIAQDAPLGVYPDPFDALACAYKSARIALQDMDAKALIEYDAHEAAQAAPGLNAAFNVQSVQRAIGAKNKKALQ